MLKIMIKYLLVIICALSLVACSEAFFPMIPVTSKNIDKVQANINVQKCLHDNIYTPPSDTTALLPPARWLSQPSWMNQTITVRGQVMPFNFWVTKVLDQTGANISYQDGMNRNIPVTLNYTGTIRGALDRLGAISGYSYVVDGNNVQWQAFATQTFDVSFIPGASQYLMGQQATNNNSTLSAIAGAPNQNMTQNISGQLMTNQYSNMQGNLSVWTDLQNAIKSMLSPEGTVIVSQATTTITVRDHPQNVRMVGDYLASMNKDLSRQVALQVQVLQITLNKGFTYGIDWNLIVGQLQLQGGSGGINGAGGLLTPTMGTNFTNTSGGGTTPTGFGWGILPANENKILLSALGQQGKVSTVTQPRVVSLNNQVAQIAITTQQTYLASVSTTVTGAASTSQTALNPGVVTTGFTLYVLPKILGRDVYLQLTSELSNLDALTTVQSSTGGIAGTPIQNVNQIQAPTVTSKSFNERTMVPSGQTLVLAGFKQVNNEVQKNSSFGFDALGGMGAEQGNTEIILLITPTIVGCP